MSGLKMCVYGEKEREDEDTQFACEGKVIHLFFVGGWREGWIDMSMSGYGSMAMRSA